MSRNEEPPGPSPTPLPGFNRFLLNVERDLAQWFLFLLVLTLFRLAFIALFHRQMAPGMGAADVLLAVANGLRFDIEIATYAVLVSFLVVTLPSAFTRADRQAAGRFRVRAGAVFLGLTAILWCVTFGYFREYDAQFNHWLFNLYYDDTKAILLTIWSGYHPVVSLLGMGALAWGLAVLHRRLLTRDLPGARILSAHRFSLVTRVGTGIMVVLLIVFGSRASFGSRPLQRKDAAITRDIFLNKAVENPYFALYYAVVNQRRETGGLGLETFLPKGNVRLAAQQYFGTRLASDDLDAYLLKHAKGPKGPRPRHIFLFVMESYDAWAFLPRYASLGLTHELTALGKKGLHFVNFLPAGDGTMESLTAIITDLPFTGIMTNYQPTARTPYPSSIFETFHRLGYRTRLFYGGYLSWQRFGDFAHDQGADEVYGAPSMDAGVTTHEWGVDDEYLMRFIEKTVQDDTPSFNLIMTTSYHPPYNVDVWAKGFPLKKLPPDIAPIFGDTTSLRKMGHLWYADKCLGDFVRATEGKLTRPLYAFTGDHFGRKFLNSRPTFFEHTAVPFILYGKDVLRGITIPPGAAGSHIDIGPTLIELAAPRGFPYYAVGRDLLVPRTDDLGIGWWRVVGKDFLLDLSISTPQFHPLPGRVLPKVLPDIQALKARFDDAYGISWWRVKKGPDLGAAAPGTAALDKKHEFHYADASVRQGDREDEWRTSTGMIPTASASRTWTTSTSGSSR